ncbi:MAG: AMP-dependent synthetase and ligase [Frankiales bacterium]|nr:AMP-dependent synthetase and ligase [Frankiales bacterium]
MELSGATTANWVAKSANLLVDGLGAPQRVGLLLPLHWQTVALLLAAVATGATAVVGSAEGCEVVFATPDRLDEAADADEVLALSGHPLGAPCGPLPGLVQDYAREVPSHGDHYGGPRPTAPRVEPGAPPLGGVVSADRVLTVLPPDDADGLAVLLAALRAGAGLVLATGDVDLPRVAVSERVTLTAGVALPGIARLR